MLAVTGLSIAAGRAQQPSSTPELQQTRCLLADMIRRVGTLDAIEEANRRLLDMAWRWRIVDDSVRGLLPVLNLQLDDDQLA